MLFCTIVTLILFSHVQPLMAAKNRSTLIPYDSTWTGPPASKWMALDSAHKQIFTVWPFLDRIDVRSTVDYHLIHSIPIPSPSTLDISPDGTTLAVGTAGSYLYFFDTRTFEKRNELIIPGGAGSGVTAFVYAASGDAMLRDGNGTQYWDHKTNSFLSPENPEQPNVPLYLQSAPLARSADYSRIMMGDGSGDVQIINGEDGAVLWSGVFYNPDGGVYTLAAGNGGKRYGICAAGTLVILDAEFEAVYQDEQGCLGMVISPDGHTLYRDVSIDEIAYTQVFDMDTLQGRDVSNYFTSGKLSSGGYGDFWQAADATGRVYGVSQYYELSSMLWIALDTSVATGPPNPAANDPVRIIHVIDNIGSPQGGDVIRILCTGVDNENPDASVTIGGAPATNLSIVSGVGLPNESIVSVTTPRGTPGLADVVLTANGTSNKAAKGFQYAASRTIFPFATSPNFLVFDSVRDRLYASHQDRVEVIDAAEKKVLAPMFPASGRLANSQFAGLSISPDGNRLYIADAGAGKIHELDLTHPSQGFSIDVAKAIGVTGTLSPIRVYEMSNGQLLGEAGYLLLIDPKTKSGGWANDGSGNPIAADIWSTTNEGAKALIGNIVNTSGPVIGFWTPGSPANGDPSVPSAGPEAYANEDGTLIAAGGSNLGEETLYPEILDGDLNPVGFLGQHFDVNMPMDAPSFFIDPTGALLYKAGSNTLGGTGFPTNTVEIDDIHQAEPVASVAFPEPFSSPSTYPVDNRLLTIDGAGRTLFGSTQSGITMMVLSSVPLSIGNIQPSFASPKAGQVLLLRGSGFEQSATVKISGKAVAATYLDENTLKLETPALGAGWLDVSVKLASGAQYTATGLLHVIGGKVAPLITATTPSSLAAQAVYSQGAPGIPITITGSGFEISDTVQIDGGDVPTAFIDTSHIQATVPVSAIGQAGSLPVVVISPDAGSSNTFSLPLVNPVPVIAGNPPVTVAPGASVCLAIYGAGFVYSSTLQWNGQNLTTQFNAGYQGLAAVEWLSACTTAGQAGTVNVTVTNPAPGGGVSNIFQVNVASSLPVPVLTFEGPLNSIDMPGFVDVTYYTIPTSITIGSGVLNTAAQFQLVIGNLGTGNYTLSSASITTGPVSIQPASCPTLPAGQNGFCQLTLTYDPKAAGSLNQTLTMVDNAPGSPHKIKLVGTAIRAPLPLVTLAAVNALDDTVSAIVKGNAVLGDLVIPAKAWIEYGTDPDLKTFAKSAPWSITGNSALSGNLSGLSAGTLYAVRLAVQSAGGIGRSAIHLFATLAASPQVIMSTPPGKTNTVTIAAGKTATFYLNATDGGYGYIGEATFSCNYLPKGSTCTFSPSSIKVTGATKLLTVRISTKAGVTLPGSYLVQVSAESGGARFQSESYFSLTVK